VADPTWFGGRLRELREGAGLTRKQLADKAGLRSEKGIRDIEQGLRMPYWDTVLAVCDALDVTPDAFIVQPEEREPPGPGRPPKLGSGQSPVPQLTEEPPPPKRKPRGALMRDR